MSTRTWKTLAFVSTGCAYAALLFFGGLRLTDVCRIDAHTAFQLGWTSGTMLVLLMYAMSLRR